MSESFLGKHLPTSIWSSKILHIPRPLQKAHKDFLEESNWLEQYTPKLSGAVGGESEASAQDHVINRFLNSAARMQYVCSDPNDEQTEVRDMILDQLADGEIYILDLAAGNGAGTLAILSLISQLREENLIPKLPININITGVDFSPDALNYYAGLLHKITGWLNSNGLSVELKLCVCDLGIPAEFSQDLEDFFEGAKRKQIKRFLCVISAISGIKKEGMGAIHSSLTMAAAYLGHRGRNSSMLWVEPRIDKSWLFRAIESVRLTMQRIKHRFFYKGEGFEIETEAGLSPNPTLRPFFWHDPYVNKATQSWTLVTAFRNEHI